MKDKKLRNKYNWVPDGYVRTDKIDRAIDEFLNTNTEYTTHRYCVDISLAWRLLGKLRKSRFCCVRMDFDHHYTCGIKLIEEYRQGSSIEYFDEEAAKNHEPSLWLDVPDGDMATLISVAFVWANKIEVPGVVMPWEEGVFKVPM